MTLQLAAARALAAAGSVRAGALALVALAIASSAWAQDPEPERVMAAMRAAVMPALPFPESDEEGSLPKDGKTTDAWMVRPHAPGDRSIEVIANPLNLANQQRATKAMAQIQASLESAQRRSEAQYERAIAEAKRTGRSQDVDGVTLSDEGLAGARIDAEDHVTIDVEFNQPAYSFAVASSIAPAPSRTLSIPGAAALITVPSNVYRQKSASSTDERFCPAETIVFFGAVRVPEVDEPSNNAFTVTAAGTSAENAHAVRSVVVRLRGNETLIAQILRGSEWTKVVELLK